MSTIAEQVTEQVKARQDSEKAEMAKYKAKASDFLIEVAVRELNYESRPNDAADLMDVMYELGLTLDDYKQVLEMVPKIAEVNRSYQEALETRKDTTLYRLLKEQARKRFDVDSAKISRKLHHCQLAESTVASHDHNLTMLSRQHPLLFADGKLRATVLDCKLPERPAPAPTKACKFCGVDIPKASESDYCGFPCQRDGEALEALQPKKGKK